MESEIVSAKQKTAHHQHHNQQEHNNKNNNDDDSNIFWQHKTDREDNDYCRDRRDHYDDRDLRCLFVALQTTTTKLVFVQHHQQHRRKPDRPVSLYF